MRSVGEENVLFSLIIKKQLLFYFFDSSQILEDCSLVN
jgi:hypothetical protein